MSLAEPQHGDGRMSPAAVSLLARLSELAVEPDRRIFAVMDGARFENLPALLQQAELPHRPLYRQTGDNFAVVQGGPWLVDLSGAATLPLAAAGDPAGLAGPDAADLSDEGLQAHADRLSAAMLAALQDGDPTGGGMLAGEGRAPTDTVIARLQRIIGLADGRSAAVFWSGGETLTPDLLYRHLRGINRILVPRQGPAIPQAAAEDYPELAAAGEADAGETKGGEAFDMVIFRHADPNVMMQVFPTLDGGQAARLFGPADLLFFAPDAIFGGGVKRARRPDGADGADGADGKGVPAPLGPLRLAAETIRDVGEARRLAERRRIGAYLRKVLPETQNSQSDEALQADIAQALAGARGYGVSRHDALCRWSYLHVMSNGAINDDPKIRQFMTSEKSHHTPDHRVRQILQAVIHRVKEQA